MPRTPLTAQQRMDYKVLDLKGWVVKQMKLKGKLQKDLAEALGLSQGRVSQMLEIPDPKKKKARPPKPDPFSYGQLLIMCEFFEVDGEERQKLLTL